MLPFTADILFSSFEQYNRSVWPLPLLACLLALAAIVLTLRPVYSGDRAVALILAAMWLWTGIHFHFLYFAQFDFAAPAYGAVFAVQGLLLVWTGAVRGSLTFRLRPEVSGVVGLALAFIALAGLPLADWLAGYAWQSVRLVGLAPGPTAVFTLGLLLLAEDRTPIHLAVVPLLWSFAAGATGWILGIAQDLALPAAGLVGFGLILLKNGRQGR